MIYLKKFNDHNSYEAELNGGGVDFKIPNVSYCKDVKDVHFNPYNLIEFYVGEITGTTPQTVKIYTDSSTSIDFTVSEGNKWYSYVLPKDKGLYWITGNSVKKVVVKADITTSAETIIPKSVVEASFKGSNTSKVTNMGGMFNGCSGLTSLDLSNFVTSKVTHMRSMFNGCSGLTSLDLSYWDTSNVTSMLGMFSYCASLTSLDLSKWDTSKVTDMKSVFNGCRGLTSLDLSGWDTSNVTSMSSMFNGCRGLTSLDLRNFNTSNVTNMNSMFNGCSGLTSLVLSGWNTSNVIDMYSMFHGCSGLTSLDLSGWNTSNVTDMTNMRYMFDGCTSLTTIKMVGCKQPTINKIKTQLTKDGIINNVTIVTE